MHQQMWMSREELMLRPVMHLRRSDLLTLGDDNEEESVEIPVAFAAPMRLLRQKHMEELSRGDFGFLEEESGYTPEMDWSELALYPTRHEFLALTSQLEAAKNRPPNTVGSDGTPLQLPKFCNRRKAIIHFKMVAIWLLTQCENAEQCANVIGHYPIDVLFVVIGHLLRSVRPMLVAIGSNTIVELIRINLLSRELTPSNPNFPCSEQDLLRLPSTRRSSEDQEAGDDNVMEAIRLINVRILEDMETTPSGTMRDLAKFIPYHVIGLVKDYCLAKYNYHSHRLDILGIRNLMIRHINLRRAAFELVRRVGTAYFTVPGEFFNYAWEIERSDVPPGLTKRQMHEWLEARVHKRIWLMVAQCFMNIIASGCQEAYAPGTNWPTAVVNSRGMLYSPPGRYQRARQ